MTTGNKIKSALAAILVVSLVTTAFAQSGHGNKSHKMMTPAQKTDSAATKAFRKAADKMHADMTIRYSNDVDVDFVRGMIPHHQGAISMAKIALQHSKDPEIRKLAEDIVKAQETEIGQMQQFLKRKGAK